MLIFETMTWEQAKDKGNVISQGGFDTGIDSMLAEALHLGTDFTELRVTLHTPTSATIEITTMEGDVALKTVRPLSLEEHEALIRFLAEYNLLDRVPGAAVLTENAADAFKGVEIPIGMSGQELRIGEDGKTEWYPPAQKDQ